MIKIKGLKIFDTIVIIFIFPLSFPFILFMWYDYNWNLEEMLRMEFGVTYEKK